MRYHCERLGSRNLSRTVSVLNYTNFLFVKSCLVNPKMFQNEAMKSKLSFLCTGEPIRVHEQKCCLQFAIHESGRAINRRLASTGLLKLSLYGLFWDPFLYDNVYILLHRH